MFTNLKNISNFKKVSQIQIITHLKIVLTFQKKNHEFENCSCISKVQKFSNSSRILRKKRCLQ